MADKKDDFVCPGKTSDSGATESSSGLLCCSATGCSYMTVTSKTMARHVLNNHPKPRSCDLCGYVASSLKQRREHIQSVHADDTNLFCDQCSYVGSSIRSLLRHKKGPHIPKEHHKVVCTQMLSTEGLGSPCTTTFKTISQLRDHLADVHYISAARHKVTERFACMDDFEAWKAAYEQEVSAEYTAIHSLRNITPGDTAVFCCSRSGTCKPQGSGQRPTKSEGARCTSTMCAKMTADGELTATVYPFHYGHCTDTAGLPHLRVPDVTRADAQDAVLAGCDLYSYECLGQSRMGQRVDQCHSEQRPYSDSKLMSECQDFSIADTMPTNTPKPHRCDLCGKAFRRKGHLIDHHLTHTGQKPHGCDVCGKAFSHRSHLTVHLLTHTGQKLHSCDICGKAFSQKATLRKHNLIHTGQRSHSCDVCGKAFRVNACLTRHLLSHTEQKPFKCGVCGKALRTKRSLTRHVLAH